MHAGGTGSAPAAADEREPAVAQQCRDLVEALRMARHDHDERASKRHARERVEQQYLLALARARREEHRPLPEQDTQPPAAVDHRRRGRDIELEVPGDGDGRRAERLEPCGVGVGLRADGVERPQRLARERGDPRVATRRLLRQPGVREQERHAAAIAFAHQVRPQLGLHEDAERRSEVRDEPPDRPREVIGQESERRELAVEARRRLAAGCGHVGDEERVIRKAGAQRCYQRLRRAGLAERDRVDPDHRPIEPGTVASEALADVAPVARLLSSAPPQPQRQERQRQVERDRVEHAQHQPSAGATSPSASSTSATDGGLPIPPRSAERPSPRGAS